jgi:betaine-aldehyde dehydrogenase
MGDGDRLLIGGELRAGTGPPIEVVDPSTEQVISEVASATIAETDAAVGAARRAHPGWWARSQPERSAALHRISEAIRNRREELATALTHETGRSHVRNGFYVDTTADIFRMYAELARVHGGRIAPSNDSGQLSLVMRVPYGVVAALVPWNYPFLLLVHKVAPALAVGNTVVIKPASETPLATLLLAEIFAEHLPGGVANVVAGSGRTVGDRLVRHPQTDMVAFTGSTEVGIGIGRACAEATKPAHLELGGKDPAIVFDDVDLAVTARAVAWAAFLNTGQVCTSTERVYVHRSVHDEFVGHLVRLVGGLRVGDPFDPATHIGPMRNETARAFVLEQIADAAARGATVVAGGDAPDRPGFFMSPTVLVGVDHGMSVMRTETFGPLLPVMPFGDDDEAFRLAADTPYGLGASIYTLDARRVETAAHRLQVGNLWVNDPVVDNVAAPFGGMRASGNARELGLEGLFGFTAPRHVHWNLDLDPKPWWYPYQGGSDGSPR